MALQVLIIGPVPENYETFKNQSETEQQAIDFQFLKIKNVYWVPINGVKSNYQNLCISQSMFNSSIKIGGNYYYARVCQYLNQPDDFIMHGASNSWNLGLSNNKSWTPHNSTSLITEIVTKITQQNSVFYIFPFIVPQTTSTQKLANLTDLCFIEYPLLMWRPFDCLGIDISEIYDPNQGGYGYNNIYTYNIYQNRIEISRTTNYYRIKNFRPTNQGGAYSDYTYSSYTTNSYLGSNNGSIFYNLTSITYKMPRYIWYSQDSIQCDINVYIFQNDNPYVLKYTDGYIQATYNTSEGGLTTDKLSFRKITLYSNFTFTINNDLTITINNNIKPIFTSWFCETLKNDLDNGYAYLYFGLAGYPAGLNYQKVLWKFMNEVSPYFYGFNGCRNSDSSPLFNGIYNSVNHDKYFPVPIYLWCDTKHNGKWSLNLIGIMVVSNLIYNIYYSVTSTYKNPFPDELIDEYKILLCTHEDITLGGGYDDSFYNTELSSNNRYGFAIGQPSYFFMNSTDKIFEVANMNRDNTPSNTYSNQVKLTEVDSMHFTYTYSHISYAYGYSY